MPMSPPAVRLLVATLVCCTLAPPALQGQDGPDGTPATEAPGTRIFGSLGVGGGSAGPAGLMALTLRTGKGDVVARLSGSSDAVSFLTPGDDVSDAALLYGRLRAGDAGWLRVAAGPGYVESERVGAPRDCFLFFCSYDSTRSSTVGVALQVDAGTNPRRRLGIGVSAFANLNSARAFAGLTVSLHVGRVAPRLAG